MTSCPTTVGTGGRAPGTHRGPVGDGTYASPLTNCGRPHLLAATGRSHQHVGGNP